MTNSRIPGFYKQNLEQRFTNLVEASQLSPDNLIPFHEPLPTDIAQNMIENVVGTYTLPLGIGLNFMVNGRDVLIPMVLEEPSVVAGASFMAKLARTSGGFVATSTEPLMIGQLQVLNVSDLKAAKEKVLAHEADLLAFVDSAGSSLKNRGGGARNIEVRIIDDSPIGAFLVVHLLYDVRDAMGANAVNTASERLAPKIEEITGGRVHLKILSNLSDRRMAKATCKIPVTELAFDSFSGEEVRDGIIAAYAFAAVDPYRAATHNKGIMNGIDPVIIATGNDWRAIEAGAHAYASRNGRYTSLSIWETDSDGNLIGTLEMPLAVGIVGGTTKVHPAAQASLKLMGVKSANELAEIIVSVGLAQNMAALRALATEGIQRGHMSLHARQIAIAAGATGNMIEKIASQLVEEKVIRLDRAQEILKELNP